MPGRVITMEEAQERAAKLQEDLRQLWEDLIASRQVARNEERTAMRGAADKVGSAYNAMPLARHYLERFVG